MENSILIIDKDDGSRHALSQFLQKRGYGVTEAGSGQEGLQRVRELQPALIITESNLSDFGPVELLGHLRSEPHSAVIPAVIFTERNDPGEMERCLGAGYSDYYVKSGMAMLNMIDAIPRILTTQVRPAAGDEASGLVCVFLSAKGGTGTSSLCANIGMSMAHQMARSTVAVADMVLPIGSIGPIAGYEGQFNLVSVSDLDPRELTPGYFRQSLVVPPNWLFHLLPGAPDPDAASRLNVEHIPAIIASLRKAYDYVLIDFGRTLSRISLPVIQAAHVVVVVMGTDLSSVRLTKILLQYLLAHGIDQRRIFPVLNRSIGLEGLSKPEAESILGMEIRLTVPYMTGNFSLANNQHMPITLKFPTDSASLAMHQAATEISQKAIKVKTGSLKPAPAMP